MLLSATTCLPLLQLVVAYKLIFGMLFLAYCHDILPYANARILFAEKPVSSVHGILN
jgi:hypothetical protein